MLGRQIDYFLQMMAAEKGAAQNSITAYERDLRQFLEFGNFLKDTDLTKQRIEQFIQHLRTKGFASKSIARKLSAVREFCKFLYSEKIITDNPAQNILTVSLHLVLLLLRTFSTPPAHTRYTIHPNEYIQTNHPVPVLLKSLSSQAPNMPR